MNVDLHTRTVEDCRLALEAIRRDLVAVAEVLPGGGKRLALAVSCLESALASHEPRNDPTVLRDAALSARNILRSLPSAAPWVHKLGTVIPALARTAHRPILSIVR